MSSHNEEDDRLPDISRHHEQKQDEEPKKEENMADLVSPAIYTEFEESDSPSKSRDSNRKP